MGCANAGDYTCQCPTCQLPQGDAHCGKHSTGCQATERTNW